MEQQQEPNEDHGKTLVTVDYTGNEPFSGTFAQGATFGHIKLKAMASFDLESSAADKYVLQLNGADLDDRRHVGSLESRHVHLQLTLKDEPVKG